MEKGFEMGRLRSAVTVGLIAAALFTASVTASAVIGLPGRTEQNALSPVPRVAELASFGIICEIPAFPRGHIRGICTRAMS